MTTGAKLHVPYLDLRAQYDSIEAELWPALRAVFEKSAFVLGPAVADFEDSFAAFCGAPHCAAVNNGTSALHLALLALGVGPGDEVITQANTFIATLAAILYTGAKPVLVDVSPPSYAIDVDAVRRAITARTKAIIPVHLFGNPCDLDAIGRIAADHGVQVIEDASQAHGATYRGAPIGARNTVTFSFYPGKNLGAAGEGGAVASHDPAVDTHIRLLRNHGSEVKYRHDMLGYNYRLEGLQGAVLGVKLRYLATWTAARQRIARRYDELLAEIERPALLPETTSARHVYAVLSEDRDRVAAHLKANGIESNIHYPIPCHLQPGYRNLGYHEGDFPNAERFSKIELSLPIYPEMSDEHVRYVVEMLRGAL